MRLPNEPDRPPQINIVPMIDVIFAILVYFIVSSLFLTRSEGLPVNLPQAATVQSQNTKQIIVSLDREGVLTIGDRIVKLSELQTEVKKSIKTEQTTVVVIKADKIVSHGQVVDIIDRLRQIPQVKLAIAATKKS